MTAYIWFVTNDVLPLGELYFWGCFVSKRERCVFNRESLEWHKDGVLCSGAITRHHAPVYRCEGGMTTIPCCTGHQKWLHALDKEWIRRENADNVVPIDEMAEPVSIKIKEKRLGAQARARLSCLGPDTFSTV
ncbi:hypothetical protein A3A14_04075 [Candidatus Daviesbacteria bacterium RIFCSPLOWO2_01_FULL_43_38]|uniref:Uncharacterized protein n=1 Tax=Candidatus Daviesbacteria bacterium RIFCSPHIGHO2_12_FULL_43_11 TaxID=1797780 RepID=A0A1F5K7A7_9BACT|nr:MAG: hypothetical protein A2874_04040 [Candidatus Daviesbacteria bacterium RIFCSPHIGHO2_01_FULL_43_17]OGE36678.1 MAG: hypothetical protein A3E45_02815 [Candidatus Daviesbacteria bacterium RIFCSPHIGHO2_12_FULL_43_11]OGE64034.1 MAG: hypothetical protein A3A14_04075 [Candidatus Daviesbacteria bacterium RIFCSPLOWO2_01_FULL_43_38]